MNAHAGNFGEGVGLPFIIDEELYNKLLFKALSLQDLKMELKRRNISCSVSDTYYILRLKLRLQILKDSNADSVHIQPIIDEINYLLAPRVFRGFCGHPVEQVGHGADHKFTDFTVCNFTRNHYGCIVSPLSWRTGRQWSALWPTTLLTSPGSPASCGVQE